MNNDIAAAAKPENIEHKRPPIIAHAGGMVNGIRYTNSLEACFRSISVGFQFIELDVVPLLDGYAIAHDGYESRYYGLRQHFSKTSAKEFEASVVNGYLSPLTFAKLDKLTTISPRTKFVLDTKFRNSQEFIQFLTWLRAAAPILSESCVVQVYSKEDGESAVKLGFNRMIFALWKNFDDNVLGARAIDSIKHLCGIAKAEIVAISMRLYRWNQEVRNIDDTRIGDLLSIGPAVALHDLRDTPLPLLWNAGYGMFVQSEQGLGFNLLNHTPIDT